MIEVPPSGMTEANCILNANMTWTGTECICKDTYIQVGTQCLCPAELIVISGSCAPVPSSCGNAIQEPIKLEECDDGNRANGDGCNEDCNIEDGFSCTDVNRLSFCFLTEPINIVDPTEPVVPICGDGLFDPTNGEFCDDGNTDSEDGCDQFCRVEEDNY